MPHQPPRHPSRKSPFVATALVAAFAAFAVPAPPALGADRPLAERPLPVLRVDGVGEKSAAPDMAVVNFGVVREAVTARQALDACNAAMAAVIEAMKGEGIEARDLQTANFSISPRYSQPRRDAAGGQEEPRIVGYSVSNNLTVRVRALDRLGAILDRAVTMGVNTGGNIGFANADPSQIVAEARAEAVRDATARAKTLAAAAGVSLGQILEISETMPSGPVPMARAKLAMEVAPSAVPIEGGENAYSVTVQVTWEIVQ